MTTAPLTRGGRGTPSSATSVTRRTPAGVPYALLLPALALYGLVVLYPTLSGAAYAFTDWSGRADGTTFLGWANFTEMFSDVAARAALRNTVIIAVSVTSIQTVVGLALAIALHSALLTKNVLRTLFFAPALLPPVVIAFLWQFLLTPSGPLNTVLRDVGLGALAQNWLGDSSIALGTVIGVMIWQNAGLTMVIYLAGLQGIPAELVESASLDGASAWQRLVQITIPLLIPATTVAMSLTLISSLKVFDQVFAMTGGGPGYATETLSVIMYKEAFVSGRFGYSTAIALVLTMIVFAFALVQLGALRKFEVDR
ncbi:carbohydrate ABC transporter permease [Ruania alba]|uniref:Carbohydrate ABC transporter membrane protein 1, CUT1 family n=1 Tax=Ruania alba TaxID=648782 RepID=A0A1H5MAE0_9MICO|nr:sugar ABC transporter permease [Ruania alba]SEE86143.1 carbohydrate ABC transporter membrane protein 1, CUT1 family [Ruania alba]